MVTLDDAGRDAPDLIPPDAWPALVPFVEHAWIQGACRSSGQGTRRIVPDASAHVIIAVPDAGPARGVVVGGRSTYCDIGTGRRFTVGVRLRPGVLPLLTDASAKELVDGSVALSDVLPEGERVLELAASGRPVRALECVLAALDRRLRDRPAPDWRVRAVDALWREGGHVPGVTGSARRLGLANRTLHQATTDAVGLSPSGWIRITRLHRAIRIALARPDRTLGRIAVAAGYYDQPHMARDFRDLLGEAPSAFLARGLCRSVQGTPRGHGYIHRSNHAP